MEKDNKIVSLVKRKILNKWEKDNNMSIGAMGESEYMEFIKDKEVVSFKI